MNGLTKKELGDGQQLFQMKILEDNYTYILSWDSDALVVDPGDAHPVLELLDQENLKLVNVLLTHHHADHTGGVETLKKKTDCTIIGPVDDRIAALDRSVDDGEELIFGPFSIEVLATPGHTKPHVVYFFRDLHLLFTGDLLFSGGCGKLFEGSPQEMWNSLEKVMALPDDTAIYCGHEYTVKNLEFAHHIEPENAEVSARLEQAKKLISEGKPTIPSTLADEKRINPFLRAHCQSLRDVLNMPEADPVTVFAHLRELKDHFNTLTISSCERQ